MRSLSKALWFSIGSGFLVGWLGIIFAISEGSGVMAAAVALAASGVTFGLLGIAMARCSIASSTTSAETGNLATAFGGPS